MPKGSPQRRLGNLEQSAESTAASFSSLPVAGGGHHDTSTGAHPVPASPEGFWAVVQPVSNSEAEPIGGECSLRHAWAQEVPTQGGCWGTPEYQTTSGTENTNPAFDANGGMIVNTSQRVWLRPGSAYFDNSSNTIQQEYVFQLGGNTNSSSGTSAIQPIRVVGGPYINSGSDWYDGRVGNRFVNSGVRFDGEQVWLRQWKDISLTVGCTGNTDTGGCYLSKKDGSKAINTGSETITRDTYLTTEYPGQRVTCIGNSFNSVTIN